MGSVLGTILAFIIVFGILVFVHEFGHFFMAKLVGIRVEVFSFGYGKRLFGFKKGDTDYRVSLIPMGGYVKFPGEDVYEKEQKVKSGDFMAAKRWQRLLTIVMGPVMNILLAIVLVAAINMVGAPVPVYQSQTPVIGWIEPDSPAEKTDLQIDDEILSIDSQRTKTWSDVELAVGTKPKRIINLEVKRGGDIFNVELLTEGKTIHEMGYAGFFGKILTEIKMLIPDAPAEKAGLKPGDVILEIDGRPAYYFQFLEMIQNYPNVELHFRIQRGEEILDIPVTPRLKGDIGEIGIAQVIEFKEESFGFFKAFGQSIEYNIRLTFLVINFIKDLVTGEATARQLGGPIEIASLSYTALRMGLLAMMGWIALISLQLGIINLFPIPVLDGGQILVISLEGIFRRDFSPKVKQIVMQIGFAMFIVLIVFVILNDVAKRLPNGWNSLIPF
ncbi:MAG: RIP metalloprotease RseP [Candidatus Aminicenantes bacterium]|nr:RIP metalloprotease RseP [Candidatus Aminicenantes bacterium]